MTPLISPQEVVALALPANTTISAGGIVESHISAAQHRFLLPALGTDMLDAISNGRYATFCSSYLHMPLALFVLYSSLPELTLKMGSGGVAVARPDNHVAASSEDIRNLRAHFRRSAEVLLKEAVNHLVANNNSYPEFRISDSVTAAMVSGSGIIIV